MHGGMKYEEKFTLLSACFGQSFIPAFSNLSSTQTRNIKKGLQKEHELSTYQKNYM
jgi:hypothetical protein